MFVGIIYSFNYSFICSKIFTKWIELFVKFNSKLLFFKLLKYGFFVFFFQPLLKFVYLLVFFPNLNNY